MRRKNTNTEKPKNLTGTWKKLLGYCRGYAAVFMIAIFCAAAGTVFTLVGPDQLSALTDTITQGIAPDTEKFEDILEQISQNVSANMQILTKKITKSFSDKEAMRQKAEKVTASSDISDQEKQKFLKICTDMEQTAEQSVVTDQLLSLSEDLLQLLFTDIEVNGVTILAKDQLLALRLSADTDKTGEHTMPDTAAKMPASVMRALYTDLVIDNVTISSKDQADLFAGLSNTKDKTGQKGDADAKESLEVFEKLPDSIDRLIKPAIDMEKIRNIALFLIGLYGLSYLLSALQGYIMATVTQRISRQMRCDISRKMNRLPMWYYNRTTTGDVLSRVTNDVDTIGQSLNQSIGHLISSIVLFFGSLVMMLATDGWMTLTAVGASLLGFVLMFAIMGRSQKYFIRQQRHLGEINGHIEEIYTGHTVVKTYNGEAEALRTFDQMNRNLCESGFKAQCLSGLMMPVMGFIGNLGYVAVCVAGGAMALDGRISFGVIVAFMMYVRYFTQPLSQIAQAVQSLQSTAAAAERVFEFLEAEEMEDETGKIERLEQIEGRVEFDHVKFGYEDSDQTVIHDFSATAKPGQKIAIVGPTGAGKTTMVSLLMRFHEIQGGEIRIDGIPVSQMKRETVHEQFCMVLQDTWLFEGTIRENLVYCAKQVSEEKIKKACCAVGLDHFIRTLPQGYDTILNDQVSLSQGQKQQLTIARAMIADKPMLILDEATSSVDTRTEQQIQAAMDQLMENRTSFVIAHRLSTIKNADLILVMKDGDIIESGTHEELIRKDGFYAGLYNSQFEQAS